MKLGILICDRVKPELREEFGDYPQMFNDLLSEMTTAYEVAFYFALDGELPEHPDDCDAYLTSGSKFSVNEPFDWIEQLMLFIRQLDEAKKPLVGICFGHQLIAKALGGRVEKSSKGWGLGAASSQVCHRQGWMRPYREELNLFISHQEQVVRLPANAQTIMGSAFCPISMLQIGQHFLGMQGHPEFTSGYTLALMNLRQPQLSESEFLNGKASLDLDVDRITILKWIHNFIRLNKRQ